MQSYAVIPAAGKSRRMGQDKLFLRLGKQSIIKTTIDAWSNSNVSRVIVVVDPENRELVEHLSGMDVDIVIPSFSPPEMKDSVIAGLAHIKQSYSPTEEDAWLLAPADMPGLSFQVINQLLEEYRISKQNILVPSYEQQSGHPVLFPWKYAAIVQQLTVNQGINVLTKTYPQRNISIAGVQKPVDIDTPDEYQRALSKQSTINDQIEED
ncbi:MAG: nucleotidyltransferase family protein [Pirellulales bacterium]|jgi:molybdenum cofactor cytidylyltransferase